MRIFKRISDLVTAFERANRSVRIRKEKTGPTGGRKYDKKKCRKAQKAARRRNRR